MSISPIEAQGSRSSSSSSATENPNSHQHGHGQSNDFQSDSASMSPGNSATSVSAAPPLSQQARGRFPGGSGRRAQLSSGNHLLNFQYDPISRSRPRPAPPPPRRHRNVKPYNKDLFLQANYKFVVLDSPSYTPESMDPDKMLRWEDIICLRYSTPSSPHCPICLESPLCPQITSCGHIFCFPCILRYLLMGKEDEKGNSWKKCPLCFVMISPKDLYSIFIENVREYNAGDTVEFSLLSRRKDSNALYHKNKQGKDVGTDFVAGSYDPFSKFTFTSDVDLSMRKAMSDLDSWLVKADSGLVDDLEKLPYVCAAIEHLEQRKKYWDEHRASDTNKSTTNYVTSTANSTHSNSKVSDSGTLSREVDDQNKWSGYSGRDNIGVGTSSDQSTDDAESSESQDNALRSSYDEIRGDDGNSKGTVEVKEKDSYNFYQAADGQLIILHPLNMKCLLHHYGSHNLLPDRICGKIVQLETVTQSEATRRRFRFLSHFSLTTTFQLCEIDLRESLPPNALLPFMDEIKKREKQRKQAARKEQREKIKAETAMESPVLTFSSLKHSFQDESPVFSTDDFEALRTPTPSTMSTSPPVVGERKLFSSVTRLGYAAGHDSPALKIEDNSFQNVNQERGDSSGATGSENACAPSFAKVTSRAKAVEGVEASKINDLGKKGKKASRVLLSTAGGRRY